MPETLIANLDALESAFQNAQEDPTFRDEFTLELREFVGRPTAVTRATRLSDTWGGTVFLKREDLAHTGAHKINNAVGQVLLARRLGKSRILAETGAGQHGVATAAACARFGLECRVYMGAIDIQRQAPNVERMKLLGAEVHAVETGSRNLKAAVNEALRAWLAEPDDTHYLIGSAVGPRPFPQIVRYFQSVIGDEARAQIQQLHGSLPDHVVAFVGGGSNAIGTFSAFLNDDVQIHGAEAGGAASLTHGSEGVLHGALSYVLQDSDGQVRPTHSISAGLDYPGVGPDHAALHASGRVAYETVSDDEALQALRETTRLEGILPALESAHALALAKRVLSRNAGGSLLVTVSGRGDKDMATLIERGLA